MAINVWPRQKNMLFSSIYYLIYLCLSLSRLALRIFIYLRITHLFYKEKAVVGMENQQPTSRFILIQVNMKKQY